MTTEDKLSAIKRLRTDELGPPQAETITRSEKVNTAETSDNYVGMRIIAEVNDLKQMTALRKSVVNKMIYFLFTYTFFVATLTILVGIEKINLKINETLLITLWGGTFGQIIGVITLIVKGLFFKCK